MVDKDGVLGYTGPENRGRCGFCNGEEGGYAKKDGKGEWQAACWPCVRPDTAGLEQPKRQTVGTVYTDVDADTPEEKPKTKKSQGMAPSSHRPKVV
jgi:hypothetical protein